MAAQPTHTVPLKPEHLTTIKNALVGVGREGTSATAFAKAAYVSAGKTGTANMVDNGVYVSGRYVASFLGFAPVHDPKIVVLVKVEEPSGVYWGGTGAAPSLREIASEALWLLGVPSPQLDAEHSSDLSLAPDKTLRRRPVDKPR